MAATTGRYHQLGFGELALNDACSGCMKYQTIQEKPVGCMLAQPQPGIFAQAKQLSATSPSAIATRPIPLRPPTSP